MTAQLNKGERERWRGQINDLRTAHLNKGGRERWREGQINDLRTAHLNKGRQEILLRDKGELNNECAHAVLICTCQGTCDTTTIALLLWKERYCVQE